MYRMTISEIGSNDAPMVEQDFETMVDALADFVNRIVDLNDDGVTVIGSHPSSVTDIWFRIESDSFATEDSVNVSHECHIWMV